ncbi:MAG TPA: hypothetical protein PKA63_05685 [Oligoflexia bacterium]|nr:hypothetical protein [Oligoflexia bacterium]HMP48141.1 hypothetical protein [Oligoflexia bacterium]
MHNNPDGLLPSVFKSELSDNSGSLHFYLEDKLPGISGHFPGYPLAPGYLQLLWVEFLLKKINPYAKISAIKDVKFKGEINPPCEVSVLLKLNIDSSELEFKIMVLNATKTSGILKL